MSYTPSFSPRYPDWEDRPSENTPADALTFEKYDAAIQNIETFLDGSTAVKPVSKTSAMTQQVGVDSNGALYTAPGGGGGGGSSSASEVSYDNTQSGLTATDVQDAIDEVDGKIGDKVNAVEKTQAMTQDVGIDSNGRLYTAPGGGGGGISNTDMSYLHKLGAKNLFPHREIGSDEHYGDNLTVTIDDEGVITLNGTADVGGADITLYGDIHVPYDATYIIDGVYYQNACLIFRSYPSPAVIYETIIDTDTELSLEKDTRYGATLQISSSATFDNVKIRPMIRLKKTTFVGQDVEKEFVPYAKTNNQLTKDVKDFAERLDNLKIICCEKFTLDANNWGSDPWGEINLPIYNDDSFTMNHMYILSIEVPYFPTEAASTYLARLQAFENAGIKIYSGILIATGTVPSVDIPIRILYADSSYVRTSGDWE